MSISFPIIAAVSLIAAFAIFIITAIVTVSDMNKRHKNDIHFDVHGRITKSEVKEK